MSDKQDAEPPGDDALSVSDALTLAVELHRRGNVDDAETLYHRILEIAPGQPDALNFLGMIAMFRRRADEAVDLIQRSIDTDPTIGERYANLGNVLLAAERVPEAIAAYERAVALAPDSAPAYCNLGVIYSGQRRFDEAERAYQRAIELDPTNPAIYTNYGNLRFNQGDIVGSLKHHVKAVELRPRDARARQYLGAAYSAVGDLESAIKIYREWLADEPDNPTPRYLLAACSGENIPERASDEYIRAGFDSFAESFDAKLARLDYRAPELVAAALPAAGLAPEKRLTILDAGCGTGLCGPLLAPYAARLEGVDLSAGMLERARTRNVYDELAQDELTRFLQSREGRYDLVVSADTLCYFGPLAAVCAAASRALRTGGRLIFTVERAEATEAPNGYLIRHHGRYSHARDYVVRTLEAAGFVDVAVAHEVLRQEAGAPVNGLVVIARKAQNAAE